MHPETSSHRRRRNIDRIETGVIFAAFGLVCLVGCTKDGASDAKDRPPEAKDSPALARTELDSLTRIRLPKKIEDMMGDDSFAKFADTVRYAATDTAEIEGANGCKATIILESALGSSHISHNAVRSNKSPGYLVARIKNTSLL